MRAAVRQGAEQEELLGNCPDAPWYFVSALQSAASRETSPGLPVLDSQWGGHSHLSYYTKICKAHCTDMYSSYCVTPQNSIPTNHIEACLHAQHSKKTIPSMEIQIVYPPIDSKNNLTMKRWSCYPNLGVPWFTFFVPAKLSAGPSVTCIAKTRTSVRCHS